MKSQWEYKIFDTQAVDFEKMALEIYRFQYDNNTLYRQYADAVKRSPASVHRLPHIPFLPIRFFKSHPVQTTSFEPEIIFESSGTTATINSRHAVRSRDIYKQSFVRCFEQFYGNPADWVIAGLLPSYLERSNSSLVYMVKKLREQSGRKQGGFYLNNFSELAAMLQETEKVGQKAMLIGATFGLLDFAEQFPLPLKHTTIAETGGMKGRRKEMVRAEVHSLLQAAFGNKPIHSEYGMTELLSQAWSAGSGVFECPTWMKVLVRDEEDPMAVLHTGRGGLNVIDLANIYSCSFIATDDAGQVNANGTFEVLGRLDGSDLRGCSLLTV